MNKLALTSATLLMAVGAVFGAAPIAGVKDVSAQELSATAEYWTPERRAAAIPMDLTVRSRAQSQTAEPVGPPEPMRMVPGALPEADGAFNGEVDQPFWTPEQIGAAVDPLGIAAQPGIEPLSYQFQRFQVSAANMNKFPHIAVGKLFFNQGGGSFVCSASVIQPHILLTARHCLYDYDSQVWSTNVVFFPGYKNGPNTALGPSNGWLARKLTTWTANTPSFQWDIGFIQTFNRNRTGCKAVGTNRQVEFYTGHLGYKYGGSYAGRNFDPLGYPAGAPFNGATQQQCKSSTGALNFRGEANTIEVGCDQTGGCSGGPWLDKFKLNTQQTNNLATSLNSFRWTDRPNALNGPQFKTQNFLNLLNQALALACP